MRGQAIFLADPEGEENEEEEEDQRKEKEEEGEEEQEEKEGEGEKEDEAEKHHYLDHTMADQCMRIIRINPKVSGSEKWLRKVKMFIKATHASGRGLLRYITFLKIRFKRRKHTGIAARTKTAVIFINQLRQKIGVVFGNPEVTTGGNALKFYSSVRLDIRRKKTIKRDEEMVGSEVRVKVVKNKMAPPFREAYFEIMYGEGVNTLGEVIDTAETLGFVKRSGSWYSFGEQKLGQGREKAIHYLRQHPEITENIWGLLVEKTCLNETPLASILADRAGGTS